MLAFLLLSLLSAPAQAATAAASPAAGAARAIARAGATAEPARAAADRAVVELAGLDRGALAVRTIAADERAPVHVGVWPARPWQGALLVVDVAAAEPIRAAKATFLGRELIWHRLDDRVWRAMGPVPDDAALGKAALAIEVRTAGGRARRSIDLEVLPLAWDHDELHVDPKYARLSKEAQAQVRRDRAAMAAMWRKGSSPQPLFTGNFVVPRADRTTAPYGTRRVFNGVTKSVHRGWDIDGEVGEEIRAPNAGVVTMAQEQYFSGGTLFLDHGGGLYTGYFHMDSFAVKPGDRVEAGDLLGTVGKTGRVTGPHLHWAAKIGGHYIHPASLLLFDFGRPMVAPPERPRVLPATGSR